MLCRHRPIFVLAIGGEATFAFEADSLAQAREFADSPWFTRAINEIYANNPLAWNNGAARTRAATEPEASAYRDYADEFADGSRQFLIAHLCETDRACK